MRFGVSVGNLAPAGTAVDACLEAARLADALGFDSAWVNDHVAVPRPAPGAEGARGAGYAARQPFEPLVMVAALAAATRRLQLGICVLAMPFRHPAVTAKMLATADRLSGGRVVLGAGTGWLREEFDALGLPPDHFAHRGAVTDDYLRAVKEIWTNTGPSSYRGRYVAFEDVGAYPKPLQRPHPPIVIAGAGRAALVRASRLGNGLQLAGDDPAQLAEHVEALRAVCRADRRDPDELAVYLLAAVRFTREPLPAEGRRPLAGSAEQIAEDLRAYGRAGLDHLVADPTVDDEPDPLFARRRGIERLAAEILPAFGGGRAGTTGAP